MLIRKGSYSRKFESSKCVESDGMTQEVMSKLV